MLFNSQQFIIFFAIFYLIYCFVHQQLRIRNLLLLIASYIFYGSWNYTFLLLIFVSSFVDYNIGLRMNRKSGSSIQPDRRRKLLLITSLVVNLGILGIFKYFNFFIDNFAALIQTLGLQANPTSLEIILPVGISFYTFQTISYTFDVYRRKLEPVTNFIDFATFVAFFPQLVAGPIERASRLIPQVQSVLPIRPENIQVGIYLILTGLFKKVVVADNASILANQVFNNYQAYSGIDIILGTFAFAFQIYGDFSGYSDIARGLAKLMGFELMVNFRLPYFAISPSDFWNRWHISLSTWLRDYLYIPLGGNRKGKLKTYRNLMITMILGGLWHGAAWNFIIWGTYHGLILVIYRLAGDTSGHQSSQYNPITTLLKVGLMFILTLIGWLIFRAQSIEQITHMLSSIFQFGTLRITYVEFMHAVGLHVILLFALNLWQQRTKNLLAVVDTPWMIQSLIYIFLVTWIAIYGVRESVEFIYFQF